MIIYENSRSNLCRAGQSVLCRENSMRYMICSSEENEEQPIETNNSRLMKWLGAEVIPCRKTEIAQTVEDDETSDGAGYHPYYIFGTNSETEMKGTLQLMWMATARFWRGRENRTFPSYLCSIGTGSTQSGLVSGKLLEQGSEQIIGLSISSREYDRAIRIMESGISDYFAKNHLCCRKDGSRNCT